MDKRNEPTTGGIVRVLRGCAEKTLNCEECPYNTGSDIQCLDNIQREAADRIESQEHEIEELKADAFVNALENAERIAELTARVESAERERDAAILDIRKQCETCFYHREEETPKCSIGVNGKCYFGGYDYWEWRGLPQEGEGK